MEAQVIGAATRGGAALEISNCLEQRLARYLTLVISNTSKFGVLEEMSKMNELLVHFIP